eukprot:3214158-Prorocentrum_lima.AAC.1
MFDSCCRACAFAHDATLRVAVSLQKSGSTQRLRNAWTLGSAERGHRGVRCHSEGHLLANM